MYFPNAYQFNLLSHHIAQMQSVSIQNKQKKRFCKKYTFFGSFTLFTYIYSQASSCKLIEASFINEIKCNNKKTKEKKTFSLKNTDIAKVALNI